MIILLNTCLHFTLIRVIHKINLYCSQSMWRERGKSLNYRQRIRAIKNIENFSQNNNNRLHFPAKEEQDGYIGKKQFNQKFKDQVVLAPPTVTKFQRFNKLDVHDIDGASPSLGIQSINNKQKHKKNSKSLKTIPSYQPVTPIDSLQLLLKQNPKKKEYVENPLGYKIKTEGNEEEMRSRNLQLSRHNIFGVCDYNPQIYRKKLNGDKEKRSLINPTYLSSFKLT